jgi:hypothetical protein
MVEGVFVGVAEGVWVGVGVRVGVPTGEAVAVGVGPTLPASWMSRCTSLDADSSELKLKPSLLGVSIAIDKNVPSLDATSDVRLTSFQLLMGPPGEKVVIRAPFGGALPPLIDASLQLSAVGLRLKVPPEAFVIHIRRFAETML